MSSRRVLRDHASTFRSSATNAGMEYRTRFDTRPPFARLARRAMLPGMAHGGDLIADVLARHGVTHLFTLCGGHISPILTGAHGKGIRIVDVRDEANAVFAADAVARMTGTVGVAAVTAGPGVTNAITAIKNAQMAQSPLILFGGATATLLKGRGALQDIDQLAVMKPITKWATTVKTVPALGPTVERACQLATEG